MKKIKKVFIISFVTLLLIGSSNLAFGMGDVVYTIDSITWPYGLTWIGDYLWVVDTFNNYLQKVNPSNGNILKTYSIPSSIDDVTDIAWDGTYLWIADEGNDKLYLCLIGVLFLQVVYSYDSPGGNPKGLTYNGYIWCLCSSTDKIYKINPGNGDILGSFNAPGVEQTGLAWDGNHLWMGDLFLNKIYEISPSDGSVLCSFDSPSSWPSGLSWDGDYLWVSDWSNDMIYKLEVEDDAPTAQYTWEDADGNGAGTVINFDASSSTDDCGIVSYQWDWTNDGSYDGSGEIVSHDYGDTNNHICKLKVTDCEGQTNTITNPVHAVANSHPTVEITYPNEGNIIGDTVTVTGTASDTDGTVTNVQVRIDSGQWYTASGTTSWSYIWDTTDYNKGMHTVNARSYDGIDYSDIYSITVYVNQPPTVTITEPDNGDTVYGTVIITGTASDPDGNNDVDSVKIKIEDGNWMLASGTNSWSYNWNTLDFEDGPYTIYARSYDGVNYSEIVYVSVYVDNSGNENNPPWFNDEQPIDDSPEVDIDTAQLSVYIGDSESDSFDWSITTSPNIGSNSGTNSNNGRKTCAISGLEYSTTYTWTVVATDHDGSGETSSETYSFTTEAPFNNPPILTTYDGWSDGVTPDFEKPGTEFTFKVHYYDADGQSPTVKKLKIKDPEGIWYTYTMQGSGSNSDYEYLMYFYTPGTYYYYFYFEDGHGGSDQLLPTQPYWNFDVIQNCAEKPSWDIGQKWIYDVNEFKITQSGLNVDLDPFNFELEVIQENPDYKLSLEADIEGDVTVILNNGNEIDGTLKDTELNGNIFFDKSDIGLKKVTFSMVGTIDRPILDIDFELNAEIEPTDGLYEFFNFPICEDDLWMIYEEPFDISYTFRYKIGIWFEEPKDFEEPIRQHGVECLGVETVNGYEAFHLMSGSIGDYWYSPARENIIQAIGSVMGFEADMVLTGSPPYKPSSPEGQTRVKVGETWTYTTSTTDPNGDRIIYGWDWNGDKIVDEWTTNVYRSGDVCSVSHTWTSEELNGGDIQLLIRAKDVRGEESLWADPLTITITKNKAIDRPFLNFVQNLLQNHLDSFQILKKIIMRLGLQ